MVIKGELGIGNAKVGQRPLAAAPDANHLFQGVVGAPGDCQQPVTGAQHPKQGRGDGMGATHKLQPHGGRLGLQHPGKHPVQNLAALIPVAVATHRSEVLGAQPFRRKGVQDPR